jgi:hypothetical protein
MAALLGVVVLAAGACSSSTKSASGSSSATTAATRASVVASRPPAGPAATLAGPLTGGKGIALVSAGPGVSLKTAGYTEAEYTAAGTATSYRAPNGLPADGRFQLQPDASASYETRIVVRRPADPAKFNGTVVVEWLNVSSGSDSPADYTYVDAELVRQGFAWVGVSAQRIGVEGGPVVVSVPGLTGSQSLGLKGTDPARYGALHHPGDAYAYDMYTQVARALRRPGAVDPLHGLDVKRLLAMGESQAAIALTTYVDGVQPLTHEFDGFLMHSRGGGPAPLGDPGKGIQIADSLTTKPTIIRTDQSVPVILAETETDVLGLLNYAPAQQPDNAHLRLWEMAGTAHADKQQVGAAESYFGCALPINRGQQTFVLRAALQDLNRWAEGGPPPPRAPRLAVKTSDGKATYVLNSVGNVEGGVRTPLVDAPVDVLSGLPPPNSSIICLLSGTTTPIPAATLAQLYPTKAAYLADYTKATDAAIKAGFVLGADRAAVLAQAQPARIPAR